MDNRAERSDYHYTRNNDRQYYRGDAQYRPPYWSRNYAPRHIVKDLSVSRIHAETPFITDVLEALVVEDPIVDLIIGNHGKVSDRPLKEWLNDSNNDNDRKGQPRYANAVTRTDSRTETASASVPSKDEPKTELNCLDYNAFRKEVEEDRSLDLSKANADGRGPHYMDKGLVYKKSKRQKCPRSSHVTQENGPIPLP
ncbi:hypothetical protein PoB_000090400 [Plakobranchus ocellatus]|uniref:Uncharacterized protein n=1 Tax=Plakobranchus ocellatus TaxID=259542 RepID=A0AAV3XTX5_9GAST|nr:hypothetical protein PoB_000090400 [Plakobranchus ocellatus]